ncbi:MAG: class B sortase [Lachnospiraceae bacterium]|jgi:sortase B|nr:class B sortase [Lachnospiraceae bacterium]
MAEYRSTKHHRGRRTTNKKKKRDWLFIILMVLAVGVFLYSGWQLFSIGKGYLDGRSEYNEIRDIALLEDIDAEGESFKGFRVNFEELLKINGDTIAWIKFDPEPSIINYPVVQGADNSQYLHQTFSANENTLGAIFMDMHNDKNFNDRNTIIYGHRMKDGSMFRHLQDYDSKEFWEANQYFYIYTPDNRELTYHIYSMGEVRDTSDTYRYEFVSDEEYAAFIQMTKQVSLYDTGITPTLDDKVVTLSTCTSASNENRFVVRGVLIKEAKLSQ